jgi:hypothetical protein
MARCFTHSGRNLNPPAVAKKIRAQCGSNARLVVYYHH